jgi:dolichol-phosphate mannosyltransferase
MERYVCIHAHFYQPPRENAWLEAVETEAVTLLRRWATALARRATGTTLSDPMSGLFMVRSDVLRRLAPNLSGIGFKILLDIFITAPEPLRFIELPYQFRARASGTSKMDAKVVLEFFELLIDKVVGHIVPAKFVIFATLVANNKVLTCYDRRLSGWAWIRGLFSFALASSIGALANVGIATYLFRVEQTPWLLSAFAGVLVGVVWNYTVTALFTWKRA